MERPNVELINLQQFTREYWASHHRPAGYVVGTIDEQTATATVNSAEDYDVDSLRAPLERLAAERQQKATESQRRLAEQLAVRNEIARQIEAARQQLTRMGDRFDADVVGKVLGAAEQREFDAYSDLNNFVRMLVYLQKWHTRLDKVHEGIAHLVPHNRVLGNFELIDRVGYLHDIQGVFREAMQYIDNVYDGVTFPNGRLLQAFCFEKMVATAVAVKRLYVQCWNSCEHLYDWHELLKGDSLLVSRHLDLFKVLISYLVELETGVFANLATNKLLFASRLADHPVHRHFHTHDSRPEAYEVIELLVQPFAKRFEFLFNNENSRLNDIEKPEYYLCQVEQWISQNSVFLGDRINPILDIYTSEASGFRHNTAYMFAQTLLKLVPDKLERDLDRIQVDINLLINTIKECFIFMKQMEELFPDFWLYNDSLNPLRVIFASENVFNAYFTHERLRAVDFIQSIFSADDAFEEIYGRANMIGEDNLEHIVTKVADRFTMLCQGFADRIRYLSSGDHRMDMVQLLFNNLDDFGMRLAQIYSSSVVRWPFNATFFAIINTIEYMLACTNEIGSNSIIYTTISEADPSVDFLAPQLRRYEHMSAASQRLLVDAFGQQLEPAFVAYRDQEWHRFASYDQHTITTKCVHFVGAIQSLCEHLKRHLSGTVTNKIAYGLALIVQQAIFDRLIMAKRFNRDGALQLMHDMKTCLYPTFAVYLRNASYFFPKLSDALTLLTCSADTVQVINNHLDRGEAMELRQYLIRIGVYSTTDATVRELMKHRIGFHNI